MRWCEHIPKAFQLNDPQPQSLGETAGHTLSVEMSASTVHWGFRWGINRIMCQWIMQHLSPKISKYAKKKKTIIAALVHVRRCVIALNELSLKGVVRKQAVTIYTATHLTRHLSKQKVLNPALACLSSPDIRLITVWPLKRRKTSWWKASESAGATCPNSNMRVSL